MKNGVSDEIYYFLLDWKDKNMSKYMSLVGTSRLCDLMPVDLVSLYDIINVTDINPAISRYNTSLEPDDIYNIDA